MNKYSLIIVILCLCGYANAQTVHGNVQEKADKKVQPLIGAHVHWLGTAIGTVTDVNGNFKLKVEEQIPRILVVQYVGFIPDTIHVHDIEKFIEVRLNQSKTLKEVQVKSKREATVISTIKTRNTELITTGELLKAACCNLSESFETNPSIDVNILMLLQEPKKFRC